MKLEESQYKYFIFCNECAKEVEDEFSGVYFAMFGPQGLKGEEAMLICVYWEDRCLPGAQPFACDGCSKIVAVAPSSSWFVKRHREERLR